MSEEQESAAGEPQDGSPPAENRPAQIKLEEIEAAVEFRLGEATLPLASLQVLQPGYTFALDAPPHEPVAVFSGGRRIAVGEIVRLDDRLGVRVNRVV